MGIVFAPAAALMNRLKFPQRFSLITVLFLLPLGLILFMYFTEVNRQVAFTEKEAQGSGYLRLVGELYSNVIDERLLGLPATRGVAVNNPKMGENQAQIENSLKALVAADAQYAATLNTGGRVAALQTQWEEIRGANQDALRDVYLGKMISDIRSLMLHVGDTSNLILDPDLDSYYVMDSMLLKVPELQELLAKTATLTDRVITKRSIDVDERASLIELSARIKANVEAAEQGLNVAFASNGAGNLRPAIQGPLTEMTQTVGFYIDMLEREVIEAPIMMVSQDTLITASDDALQGTRKLWQAEIPPLESLLFTRVADHKSRSTLTLGVAAGVLLLVVYMWIGFHMAVMRTVRGLEAATRALESGSAEAGMGGGIKLDSKDELSRAAAETFSKIAAATGRMNATIDERTSELTEVAAVLAHHPDGIVITDQVGAVKVLNGSASKLLATNFDAAVGRTLVDLTGDAQVQELLNAAIRMPGQQHTLDTMIGGRIVALNSTFVPVTGDKYSGLITLQDVTELRRLQHIQQTSQMVLAR
jgi:sigma-B regulation protein RsbU (phosphoserine phosphatase)